jgi:hypothetical protein
LEKKTIVLRGHHLEPLAHWQRTEAHERISFIMQITFRYSGPFANEIAKLFEKILTEKPDIMIVAEKDDVCAKCPFRTMQQCTEEKLTKNDRRIAEFYGLSVNRTYTAQYILRNLKTNGIPPAD